MKRSTTSNTGLNRGAWAWNAISKVTAADELGEAKTEAKAYTKLPSVLSERLLELTSPSGTGVTIKAFGSGQHGCANGGTEVISCVTTTFVCNGTNGSNGAAGGQGPVGPAGPVGAQGPAGPSGKVQLVRCKTVKKGKKHMQQCTTKLVSGTVKFTTTGASEHATLSRHGVVFASGMASSKHGHLSLRLTPLRRLRPGRYTLTLISGAEVVRRSQARPSRWADGGTVGSRLGVEPGPISGCTASGGICSAELQEGTEVTLTEKPGAHQAFKEWSGACSGPIRECLVTMTAAKTITATFTPKLDTLQTLKQGSGTGTITSSGGIDCGATCSSTTAEGSTIILTATPQAGSTFTGWSGSSCSGTGTCEIVLADNATVTATFTIIAPKPLHETQTTLIPAPLPPVIVITPSNKFTIHTPVNGTTATLKLFLPGPGTVTASGRDLESVHVSPIAAGPVTLKLNLTARAEWELDKRGKLTLRIAIAFMPTNASARTITMTVSAPRSTPPSIQRAPNLLSVALDAVRRLPEIHPQREYLHRWENQLSERRVVHTEDHRGPARNAPEAARTAPAELPAIKALHAAAGLC